MENQLRIEKNKKIILKILKKKNKEINTKDQIFKIVLTGILLGLSVAFSLIEIKIPIMGAQVPLRIFDSIIMAIAIPIIGIWYTLGIAIIEPWLHFAIDSDHPPIQMFFDNIANIIFVVSFVLVFYQLFKVNKIEKEKKNNFIIKNTFSGLLLVSLNAIVSSLAFVFTILILANTSLSKPDEYIEAIKAFYQNAPAIFFILLAIEIGRFLLVYVLFALVQKRLSKINRFQNNN